MTAYEAPAFDPSTSFSWTLRSAEIAGRVSRRRQITQAGLTLAADESATSHVNGNGARRQAAKRYTAPAFAPGTAFAWTLRSAELAGRESQTRNRRPDLHPTVLVAA